MHASVGCRTGDHARRIAYLLIGLLLGLANPRLVLAQGVNLEIPYEMVEVPLDTAGANSITYESTSVRIDPAKL